jgi:hypothetical protein
MATRAAVRTAVRRLLGDTAAPFVWTDDQLNDLLAEAVDEYAWFVPRVLEAEYTSTAGLRAYTVTAVANDEPLRVLAAEYPVGVPIPHEPDAPAYVAGEVADDQGYAQSWHYDAVLQKLILRNAPTDSATKFRARWHARRVCPTSDSGTVPVENRDLALVQLMVARAAWDLRAAEDAKRGLRPGRNPYGFRVDQMLDRRKVAVSSIMGG